MVTTEADDAHAVITQAARILVLRRDLGRLRTQVEALAEALADALDDPGPLVATAPHWAALDDGEYAAELEALASWVRDVLRPNYGGYVDTVLRDCWAKHFAAVWELGTLRAEWLRIYNAKRPPLADALVWHDRWLPGVLGRLRPVMKSCTAAADGCAMDQPAHTKAAPWTTR